MFFLQLSEFVGKARDLISPEEIREFCIHLKAHKKAARQTSTQAICGARQSCARVAR